MFYQKYVRSFSVFSLSNQFQELQQVRVKSEFDVNGIPVTEVSVSTEFYDVNFALL